MRHSLPARLARFVLSLGLAAMVLLPAAGSAGAANDKVLRIGTLQQLDSTNPFQTELSVGYEVFELTYDQMVGFGPNIEPAPGFAQSWERAADGKSWTFKFRPDLKWSDGQPATSADACFSWQIVLDAIAKGDSVGAGSLDPALKDSGVTKVTCPDPETMIAYTDDASNRILQTYIPVLPEHIWGKMNYKQIGDAKFDPPADGSGLVGTGPYQLVEWKTGEYVKLQRNPNYWGKQGAEDQIIIQFFGSNDTMVQALKAGEVDYVRTISPEQMKQLVSEPNIKTVAGVSNGYTELGFNTYGTGTGKTIKGGGPSTKALLDPAFRDALGYAIDKQKLVDGVLGGFGTVGTTQIPPVMKPWHTEPTNPRTFDIELAKQKLDLAGYHLNSSGARLDKEGKVISLRLVMPDSDPNFAKSGQFITEWFGQLGIKVSPQVYDPATLGNILLAPESGEAGAKADYDLFIWDWAWGPDPIDPLSVFKCDEIGTSSDSQWCNPAYDKLYDEQLKAPTQDARKAIIDEMQQMWYDAAPYHILYYDDVLHAYRTDKFGGWQNQPADGTPFFAYGILGETLISDATVVPSPTSAPPGQPAGSGPAAPSGASSGTGSSSSGGAPLLPIALIGVFVVAIVGIVITRRRGNKTVEEDE